MSVFRYAVAALVVVGAASTASLATSQDDPKPDALICELQLTQNGPIVTLLAEAQAFRPTRGTYTLKIKHNGVGGDATLHQGGEFDLQPGMRTVLSEARFTGRARDLSADMTLEANGQRHSCSIFSL